MKTGWATATTGILLTGVLCVFGCASQSRTPSAQAKAEPAPIQEPGPAEGSASVESRLPGPTSGRIVAAGMLQVYDRFVTMEQVLRHGRARFESLPDDVSEEVFRARALPIIRDEAREQIRFELLLVEAQRGLTEEQRAAIDKEIERTRQEMLTRTGGSEEALRQAMAREGTTPDDALKDQREWMTIRLYLRRKLTPSVTVTRKMLWDYYKAHRSSFQRGRRVRLRIMAVPFGALPPASIEAATDADRAGAMLEKVRKALLDGADFAGEAQELVERLREAHGDAWTDLRYSGRAYVIRMESEGGLWPEVSPEGFRDPALQKAARQLDQGSLSEVLQGDQACYLVRAEEVSVAETTSFEEAQGELISRIKDLEFNRQMDEYARKLEAEYNRLQGPMGRVLVDRFAQMVVDEVVSRYYRG